MITSEFLSQLSAVQQRGSRYSAICPAHDDRSPSLSVSEGDKGILIKCWAGCTIKEICTVLGIKSKDLFYDAGLPRSQRQAPKPPRINRRDLAFRYELAALDHRLRAEKILDAAKGLDVSALTDDELDRALGHVGKAYADRGRAQLFEHVSDTLREREFAERISHDRAA